MTSPPNHPQRDIDPWLTRDVAFVSCDESMLHVPKALAVLQQTKLTLLVCAESGHDAIAATGLMLLHLPTIPRAWIAKPQLYVVRQTTKAEDLDQRLERVARAAKTTKADIEKLRLPREELRKPTRTGACPDHSQPHRTRKVDAALTPRSNRPRGGYRRSDGRPRLRPGLGWGWEGESVSEGSSRATGCRRHRSLLSWIDDGLSRTRRDRHHQCVLQQHQRHRSHRHD